MNISQFKIRFDLIILTFYLSLYMNATSSKFCTEMFNNAKVTRVMVTRQEVMSEKIKTLAHHLFLKPLIHFANALYLSKVCTPRYLTIATLMKSHKTVLLRAISGKTQPTQASQFNLVYWWQII